MLNLPLLSSVRLIESNVLAAAGLPSWMYGVFVVAGIVAIVAIVRQGWLGRSVGGLGQGEGEQRGPRAGEGAVVHHSSGEIDFDGAAGSSLSKSKDAERDLPYPSKRAAD